MCLLVASYTVSGNVEPNQTTGHETRGFALVVPDHSPPLAQSPRPPTHSFTTPRHDRYGTALLFMQTEGIALAQAADLPADKLLTVLDQGAMSNPMFRMKVYTEYNIRSIYSYLVYDMCMYITPPANTFVCFCGRRSWPGYIVRYGSVWYCMVCTPFVGTAGID